MDVQTIKANHDIVSVVSRYAMLKKAGRYFKCLCPFHAEKTPSFVIFPDTQSWHCFGSCGAGGDWIDFVKRAENLSFKAAVEHVAGNLPPSPTVVRHNTQPTEPSHFDGITEDQILLWAANLTAGAKDYLYGRGIVSEYQDWRYVGWTGRDPHLPAKYHNALAIPWMDGADFVGVKLRRLDSGYFAVSGSLFAPFLYGLDSVLMTNSKTIVIVETELDSLLVNSLLGCSVAVAKPANALGKSHANLLATIPNVIVIPDNDNAGNKHFRKIKALIPRAKLHAVPDEYKDIGDWWKAEPEIAAEWLRGLVDVTPQTITGDDLDDFGMIELGGVVVTLEETTAQAGESEAVK
jgi:DNA primase